MILGVAEQSLDTGGSMFSAECLLTFAPLYAFSLALGQGGIINCH